MTTAHVPAPSNTGRPGEVLPVFTNGPRSFSWWGMLLFIASEATLFALLIASYFFLRFRHGPVWPPGGIDKPDLVLPLTMSAILWSSSIPVHIADRGIRKGSQLRLRLGLLAGFVLGAVFLGIQIFVEYPHKLEMFTPHTNAYGSMFYGLTGLHGLHLTGGLVGSLWVQVRAWRGDFNTDRHVSVQNFAMYWHFVDIVWAFVLSTIYLSPHL